MHPLVRLVPEVGRWINHNFPTQAPHEPLLGMIEEVEEFNTHALDHCTDRSRTHLFYNELEDALGDLMVFLAGYLYSNNIPVNSCLPEYVWRLINSNHELFLKYKFWLLDKDLNRLLGRIAQTHLKLSQKIRLKRRHRLTRRIMIAGVLCTVQRLISIYELSSLEDIIYRTWDEQVKKRDWIAFPHDGMTK